MEKEVLPVTIKGLIPTSTGVAVFLGTEDKTFVIYIDPTVGQSLSLAINDVKRSRPLTHDLITHILMGLEAKLDRIVINDVDSDKFFARLILNMENELGKKIIEIDARPSDSLVLAVQNKRPIYVARKVFDSVEDMTTVFEDIKNRKAEDNDDGDAGSEI
ncbi:MAG: bifunctional nuclease family protein [Verrucomicrobia bacterium]|nr:bifunctional nuclease family protein [Verrucomicrobiota bacterium]MDA1067019.1 bifunctional nuclease family protein [Verrucomicrobiota bacterium]